jgi:hypothetical protein
VASGTMVLILEDFEAPACICVSFMKRKDANFSLPIYKFTESAGEYTHFLLGTLGDDATSSLGESSNA